MRRKIMIARVRRVRTSKIFRDLVRNYERLDLCSCGKL
jgi:hypothetical protein